jgi:hypothetical protein
MRQASSPEVGKIENFGIFDGDYNPFTNDKIIWTELVTRLVTYPGLFFALVFLLIIYPVIDLYYILSFDFG